jgi:TRAP-type mannitol/chloroaromatic compound transport system substrate-binding protein
MLSRRALVASAPLALLSAPAVRAAERAYSWRFQSNWQAGTLNQRAFDRFAQNVKLMSGGRIEITTMPVDAVVPPTELLDAVRSNILHGMHGGPVYFTGKEPAMALVFDLNGGFDTPEQFEMWFRHGGGLGLARELYAGFGLYYLGPVMIGVESVPTRRPVRSIEDVKGLKLRAPEGLNAALWRALGAAVSTLPGTEVYTALDTGKIEATDWGTLGMNDELGYGKIAPYTITPGFHSMPATDLSINLPLWKGLPDDLKSILEIAGRELNRESVETTLVMDLRALAKRDPATVIRWSDEERRKVRKIAQGVWEDWAKKSPFCRKMYDSYLAWMKQSGMV